MSELSQEDGVILLPERMDIIAAGLLRTTILAEACDLVLDASEVAMMTTPAIQVVMAARDHQQEQGNSLRIEAPSPGFTAAAKTLGVPLDRMQTAGDTA